jgi:hypothetical protein
LILVICPHQDILYMRSTKIHKGEKMLTPPPLTVSITWACFAAYALWFFVIAKRNVPMTSDEVRMLWKIHKQTTNCPQKKWQPIAQRNGKITGFKCDCGYIHQQKRHIISDIPRATIDPKLSTLSKQSSRNRFSS